MIVLASSPLRRRILGAVFALASLGILAVGQARFTDRLPGKGIPLFLAGMALAAGSALLLHSRADGAAPPAGPLLAWEKVFLAVAFLGAAALRFPALDRFPPGGFFDELQNILVAQEILKGHWPVFVADASQMPALYFYPVAAAIAAFGNTISSIRGVSALSGALAIPVFYLLARRFFSRNSAVAATIFFAGCRWHVNFSRIGFNGIVSPLMELLTLLALAKALETGRKLHWILFGAGVAVGLQTYYAFNLFPAVFTAAVVAFAFRFGVRAFPAEARKILPGLALSVATAFVFLLPLAIFAFKNPQVFFERAGTVAIWNPVHGLKMPDALFLNIRTHLLMFNFHGDGNPRHNIPDAPLLTSIEGVLLAFGLGCALGRGFRWPRPAWLAWFFVMLLPGILTIEAPQAYRTIGVIPVLYLLIAEGLETIGRAASGTDRASPALGGALAALAIATSAWNAVLYFEIQVRERVCWRAFDGDHREIARFLAAEAAGHDTFIDPTFFDVPTFRVYLGKGFVSSRFRLSEHIPIQRKTTGTGEARPALFMLDGSLAELIPVFRAAYPHASVRQHVDGWGRVMFVSIDVPAADRFQPVDNSTRGYLASFYANAEWEGEPDLVRREPAILFHYHWDQDALPDPFGADWAARLHVEHPGKYGFELVATGPALVLLDGQAVIRQSVFESLEPVLGTATLAAGEHLLVVRYLESSYASVIRFLWRPPLSRRRLIPLKDLTALSAEEYRRIRGTLPKPELKP
ncbi:MAG: glycosyltransferase family 39 protein [Thermoanaerobaculia bacterium]|nr:glycosyltransferase family 39 protein [Thermoanaerobaculia bacterium]